MTVRILGVYAQKKNKPIDLVELGQEYLVHVW